MDERFGLDAEQTAKLEKWLADLYPHGAPYIGAIGGMLTYSFTPNSLGVVTKVVDAFGHELDLTEYGDW